MSRGIHGAEIIDLLLEAGGEKIVAGTGRSMLPLVRPGDRVRFDTSAPWGRGDVVLCRAPDGTAIVHRVLDLGPDRVLLRGDANPRPDPPFPRELVVGKVTAVLRGGREIDLTTAAMRAYGLAMVALTPAAPVLHRLAIGAGRGGARVLAGPLSPVARRLLPAVEPPRVMPASFLAAYQVHRGARLTDPGALSAALEAGHAVLVAAHDRRGALAGVAELRREPAGAELRYLWVHPLRRRQGLGAALVRAGREAGGGALRFAGDLRACRRRDLM